MSHLIFSILAQAASPAAGSAPGGFNPSPFIYLIVLGIIFYFMAIRPQNLKQKEHDSLIKSVKTGDKVITSSGIHGLVANVKETTVIVKIADNVKIELEKSSIGSVKRDASEPAPAA
jgi:preprotein translocase subunit YajC